MEKARKWQNQKQCLRVNNEKRPNVVLIISDDQAWSDYGFMGHPQIETPRLDRLARESLVFPRGYVPSSLCCPSLASMITGLYPYQHRITGNDPQPPQPMSFAQKQRDADYQALHVHSQNLTMTTMIAASTVHTLTVDHSQEWSAASIVNTGSIDISRCACCSHRTARLARPERHVLLWHQV